MLLSSIPSKFTIPWANSASAAYLRSIPTPSQIGIATGAASLTDGFPPWCFETGGAPDGRDFQGILKWMTQWQQWQQAGGPVYYDSAFSLAIGGYPAGTVLSVVSGIGNFWVSTVDGNTTNPDAGGAGWLKFGLSVFAAQGVLVGVQVFAASGTYTPTAGMGTCMIEAQGAGASAGGASVPSAGNVSLGSPGTSGTYAMGRFTAAQIGASQSVTIGAGGAAVTGAAGNAGGATSVGALISAPGGVAGNTLANQVPPTINGNGNVSSAATGGNIKSVKGGATSPTIAVTAAVGAGGPGGTSPFGVGGYGISINANGIAGQGPGAGGGGCLINSSNGAVPGGAGANGYVVVWEYA